LWCFLTFLFSRVNSQKTAKNRYNASQKEWSLLTALYVFSIILLLLSDIVDMEKPVTFHHNELLHDAIQAIIVELSKLEDIVKKPVESMTDFEKFSVFFEYAANPTYRDTVNKVIESEEVLTVASNLLMNISQDERERAIFRSRRKFQMDHASDIATAEDAGVQKGKTEAIIEVARNLLDINMPLDQIVTATGLTQKEVENLRNVK
jgi:predicted transposase/invertase (TIGR01784 family)